MFILKLRKPVQIAGAALCIVAAPAAVFAQAATPFSQLAGTWHGSGQVRLTDGSSERLSCRGSYAQKSGGTELSLSIRCQSTNAKIDMKSGLSYEGGRVSGHWEERSFGLEGEANGSASANKISLRISGQLQASMSVTLTGSTHHVSISSRGPGFTNVSIAFSRG
ncbi:MAG: hypothetical protein ACLPPF_06450 [Rhodomicrobium sp.]